jgi:hypothetical protein
MTNLLFALGGRIAAIGRSKGNPDLPEDRITGVRVSPGAIEIRRGAVKRVPSDPLQPNAGVQPGPK